MVENHQTYEHPKDLNQKIWRYIDFTKLVDLFNTESLYFARADYFEDVFEGAVTKATAELRTKHISKLIEAGVVNPEYTPEWWHKTNLKAKKEFAINCWHINDFESAAMWKLYLKSNEGIAIQSTFNRLKDSLQKSDVSILTGIVKYIDYEKDLNDYGNSLERFVQKGKSFTHENELRCVIWQPGFDNHKKVNLENGGIKIKLDLSVLIDNIYTSPDSSTWFTQLVQNVARKYNFSFPVVNSRLKDNPLF